MKRARKEEQFSVRLDEKLRIALDEIKETYKYDTDPEAIRGLIRFHSNRERFIAEIEGRLIEKLVPILETRLKEYYSTEEYKEVVRALMDEIIKEEESGEAE
jgi:Arc/MetJ-type ribon-helix-helix transcriptional regulator